MIEKGNMCRLMAQLAMEFGWGSFVAVYNDIEEKWYYFVGNFKEKNPHTYIMSNSIEGVDVTHVIENNSTFLNGATIDKQKVYTFVEKQKEENTFNITFDFRFVKF